MYKDVGGNDSHMLQHAPPKILYKEYERLYPFKLDKLKRLYIEKGGSKKSVLKSKNINKIKEEIAVLDSMESLGI
jgi:hypothetical protein